MTFGATYKMNHGRLGLLDAGVGTLVVRIEQAEEALPALGQGFEADALGEVVLNEWAGLQDGTGRVLALVGDLVMNRIDGQLRIGQVLEDAEKELELQMI